VFEDKRLADEAVAAVKKVVNDDGFFDPSNGNKGAAAEVKEAIV